MALTPEVLNGSIVLMGTFAPAQFTPDWLLNNKLIGDVDFAEMKENEQTINAASVAQLECNAFSMQVTAQRFQIISKDVLRPTINDVSKGVLSLLGKVVVSSAGINFVAHYRMPSEREYHRVGDTLAPKDIWMKLFPNPDWSAGLTDLAIKIRFAPREAAGDDGNGITMRVQPSAKLHECGIMLTYNNHANFPSASDSEEQAYKFLNSQWDESFNHSGQLFSQLLELASTGNK